MFLDYQNGSNLAVLKADEMTSPGIAAFYYDLFNKSF